MISGFRVRPVVRPFEKRLRGSAIVVDLLRARLPNHQAVAWPVVTVLIRLLVSYSLLARLGLLGEITGLRCLDATRPIRLSCKWRDTLTNGLTALPEARPLTQPPQPALRDPTQ